MNEMNILTLNGEQYEVADKAGRESVAVANQEIAKKAEINDNVIDDMAAWSSNKIVETVCPPFEVAGPVVACNPVVGYPLAVKSEIAPKQEGSGDPSPENVRTITPWNGAVLTQESDSVTKTFTATFSEPVYGGEVDWGKGEVKNVWSSVSLKSDSFNYHSVEVGYWDSDIVSPVYSGSNFDVKKEKFNIATAGEDWSKPTAAGVFKRSNESGSRIRISPQLYQRLKDNGLTLQAVFETVDVQSIAPIIPTALPGVNTLYTDTGDTTVSGRSDPLAVIANQQAQIDELKKAIVSTGGNV